MARLPGAVRGVVGPPVRRLRRELQWLRPEFRLAVGPADAFRHGVAQHATPLTVVERWRHSYDVFPDADRAQPFGSGPTCAWPVLDLQVVNRTGVAFRPVS